MATIDIQTILQEFDPIRRQIAQPEGLDTIVFAAIPGIPLDSALSDHAALEFFCEAAGNMLEAGHEFPNTSKYSWITNPECYMNSFEAWCQINIINLLIGLWEQRGYLCDKMIIARNLHTGGYHIETYETENAYFLCVSYQYLNLLNRYSMLNHYLIEIGGNTEGVTSITPTNEVGGQEIERALRFKWQDISPHLDSFLLTIAKTSEYKASEVYLNQHISRAVYQSYTDERYTYLRNASQLMNRPFYLTAEVMWTMYSDQTMNFSLAHELIHILEGDIKRTSRVTDEEIGADIGAASLLISMTITSAHRKGYRPSITGFTIGPIVFFALSQIFAYLDDFEKKYRSKQLSNANMAETIKEELTIMQRRLSIAGFLSAGRWITEPSASVFWNIVGELRLLEIALRRRAWEISGTELTLPLETEIAMEEELIKKMKKRTKEDVLSFWANQKEK